TWFLLAYTVSQALSGRLYDRIGTRLGFTVSVGIWSLAAMATATARSFFSLSFFRFILGLGEAGNWPGAAKAVAEWFPVRERAFGMSIFNGGSTIGAVVAPPIIVWVALKFGWRYAFFIGAILSLILMALWWRFYRSPDEHPNLSSEELAHIHSDQTGADALPVETSKRPWRS